MDWVRDILEASPLVALFLTIAFGYVVGEINMKGFALGSGAVLFVGLAIGAFAPKSAPPGLVGTLGLLLFLYCVGIQYGHEWYRGLRSIAGLKANFAGLCGLIAAGAVTLAIYWMGSANLVQALGMFAGSGTSTPTLQAILDSLGDQDAAVGYSVTYPFGVAGPILCMFLYFALFKPTIDAPAVSRIEPTEVIIRNSALFGVAFADFQAQLPEGVRVIAIRHEGRPNQVPVASTILAAGDVLLIVGIDPVALDATRRLAGEGASGPIATDRSELDYLRVHASRRAVVGVPLGELRIPGGFAYSYAHVRRGDSDLLPSDDLVLEYGDRVGVLCHRADFPAVRRFYGDSVKGAADFSYISIGVGAAMGLLAGLIPLPIPGARITLGLAGVLLVALGLGTVRRTGTTVWTLPLSANLVLRNFGLTVFLAQVGLSSGPKFVATVAETGLTFIGLGVLIVLALVLVTMVVGRLLGIAIEDLVGVVSGVCGNPAILAYASRMAPGDRPDIGFAMIFPSMTVLKILFVQIAPAVLGG